MTNGTGWGEAFEVVYIMRLLCDWCMGSGLEWISPPDTLHYTETHFAPEVREASCLNCNNTTKLSPSHPPPAPLSQPAVALFNRKTAWLKDCLKSITNDEVLGRFPACSGVFEGSAAGTWVLYLLQHPASVWTRAPLANWWHSSPARRSLIPLHLGIHHAAFVYALHDR